MDKKQLQILGALAVILPMLWGAGSTLIGVYSHWVEMRARVSQLEHWRCAQELPKRSFSDCQADWEMR